MKITSKGQVTIPQKFREAFGLLPNTEVEFLAAAGGVKVIPAKKGKSRGLEIVQRMTGSGSGKFTTDEVMRLTRGEK